MKITKLYSDYDEYYDEKLYSTGDEDLDELLERAFCEGYEYAQKEFAEEEEENEPKKKHTGAKVAAGVGGGAAVGAGLTALNHHMYKKRSDKAEKYPSGLHDQEIEKDRDTTKVAKGEMSEEEYAKKYATRRIKH